MFRLSRRAFALLVIFGLTLAVTNTGQAQKTSKYPVEPPRVALTTRVAQPYSRKPSKEALAWADGELKKMSLDEKIGQLISIGINAKYLNEESDEFKEIRRQVEQNH